MWRNITLKVRNYKGFRKTITLVVKKLEKGIFIVWKNKQRLSKFSEKLSNKNKQRPWKFEKSRALAAMQRAKKS